MASPPPLESVLVIGGCGFLGHHIVQHLQRDPSRPRISVLDLRVDRNRFDGVTYHSGDITSAARVREVLAQERPRVVIHTASPVAVGAVPHSVFDRVNIGGTANLLACCGGMDEEKSSVQAFVFTSSASVAHAGPSRDVVGIDETSPPVLRPEQPEYYSHTKAVAEKLVLQANRGGNLTDGSEWAEGQDGSSSSSSSNTTTTTTTTTRTRPDFLTCAIRPAGIYGEGDVQMIPGLLTAYYSGKVRFQIGANRNLFDFTYVGNIAHAHVLAARALLATGSMSATGGVSAPLDFERVDGEAFFITNGAPWPWWDFARAVWRQAGDTTTPDQVWVLNRSFMLVIAALAEFVYWLLFRGAKKPNLQRMSVKYSTMTRWYSIDKARRRLGYEPEVGVQEGIERAVAWNLEQRRKAAEAEAGGKKEK